MSALRMELAPGRWHFQHGPIDLIIEALGRADAVASAFERAWLRFGSVLTELVAELPLLRRPVCDGDCPLKGVVARRMWDACRPFQPVFITPMGRWLAVLRRRSCLLSPATVSIALSSTTAAILRCGSRPVHVSVWRSAESISRLPSQ